MENGLDLELLTTGASQSHTARFFLATSKWLSKLPSVIVLTSHTRFILRLRAMKNKKYIMLEDTTFDCR